ncbi:MAG TPA: sulfotransferase [Chthoniobacterales bacterium]|nr:sulfotransferase [Chthoniobacterales bacterium]
MGVHPGAGESNSNERSSGSFRSDNGNGAADATTKQVGSGQPILVTGSHRSGTTWVGRMIALAPNVHYIHEPFNLNHDRGICGAKFDYWFTYVSRENEQPYYRHLQRMINLRYSPVQRFRQTGTLRDWSSVGREWIHHARLRLRHPRILVKGPIAFFSADWMASSFDMEVLVMIRHPAAFASSLKIADWQFAFEDWVKQPLLLEELLTPFAAEIEQQARHPGDIIDQAALLWKCMHHVILGYKAAHPEWLFIRHEDLSLDPVNGFRRIYTNLRLDFNDAVRDNIEQHSASSNPVGSVERRHEVKLNSRANLETWKERLSEEETLRIRRQVEEVSCFLYPTESWERRSGISWLLAPTPTPTLAPNGSHATPGISSID